MARKVFSSTDDRAFALVCRRIRGLLDDVEVRRALHAEAVRARGYLATYGSQAATNRAGEMSFLIAALEKLGI